MTCEHCREELDLYFGQADLPAELQAHLETCAECRVYSEQLNALTAQMGDDALFAASMFEANRLANDIDAAIDAESHATSLVSRYRVFAAAAVIVLALGIGWSQLRDRTVTPTTPPSDSTPYAMLDTNPLTTDTVQVNSTELEEMLLEYSAQDESTAGELLQTLTDEEMQYLEKNFDVGELL